MWGISEVIMVHNNMIPALLTSWFVENIDC